MSDPAKKDLSERDICTKFITPALTAGNKWDVMSQIREEVSFTKGRVIVRGKLFTRGEPQRADYVLCSKALCLQPLLQTLARPFPAFGQYFGFHCF